jgi:hypothetical protein
VRKKQGKNVNNDSGEMDENIYEDDEGSDDME